MFSFNLVIHAFFNLLFKVLKILINVLSCIIINFFIKANSINVMLNKKEKYLYQNKSLQFSLFLIQSELALSRENNLIKANIFIFHTKELKKYNDVVDIHLLYSSLRKYIKQLIYVRIKFQEKQCKKLDGRKLLLGIIYRD